METRTIVLKTDSLRLEAQFMAACDRSDVHFYMTANAAMGFPEFCLNGPPAEVAKIAAVYAR